MEFSRSANEGDCTNGLDEEIMDVICSHSNADDLYFDSVVGHIEDILMESQFQELLNSFMEKHWHEFEDKEENKLCYIEIFKEYNEVVEKHIETSLLHRIPNFSMMRFTEQLESRKNELDGEVFEMLYTFTDFIAFKEMFLDYKADIRPLPQQIRDSSHRSHGSAEEEGECPGKRFSVFLQISEGEGGDSSRS